MQKIMPTHVKPGDAVAWWSQANGSWKEKRGTLLAIYRSGEDAQDPRLKPKQRGQRQLATALVEVIPPSRSTQLGTRSKERKPRYYRPALARLEKGDGRDR